MRLIAQRSKGIPGACNDGIEASRGELRDCAMTACLMEVIPQALLPKRPLAAAADGTPARGA